MAKLNHAKIIKGFEGLINTTDGTDFFVGFLKAFSFPASTIRNVQDPNNGRNIGIVEGDYGLAKNMYFRPVAEGQDVHAVVQELIRNATIAKHKVRFFMATDFKRMAAYDARVDDWSDFDFCDLKENYEFFLPLTGLYEKPLAYTSHPADVKACEKMGKLYDIIRATNKYDDEHLHDLNVFLTRLLFCFFAEDTGIFPIKGQMTKAIESLTNADGSDMQSFFERLFWILDMAPDRYARKQETATLTAFPYVNGGLFRAKIRIPEFNARARNILLECGRLEWNLISPVIFGSMFQAVMKPEERHALGAHFTSERNILKVIEPLFLDDLKAELQAILETISDTQKKLTKDQTDKLYAFQGKLASLTFLDPACGSGNFLIVSFREIKRLEFEAVKALHMFDSPERSLLDDWKLDASKVSINQFYGIEIEEFPVEVARVSMWLMEHVMNVEFGTFFGSTIPTIPLKDSAHIVCANALTTDWTTVVPADQLSYIMGNPPFVGAKVMNQKQKKDAVNVFGKVKIANSLDYVVAWFFKAAAIMKNTNIKASLVSTNSITQGEQVMPVWDKLTNQFNMKIDFAYRTFRWDNEAPNVAKVHCVIIGFSDKKVSSVKKIFTKKSIIAAKNINSYLVDAANIFVEKRSLPLCDVPNIDYGSMPNDGGNFILTLEEKNQILSNEPALSKWIKRYKGASDFINSTERWCFWLKDASLATIESSNELTKRTEAVRVLRESSSAAPTREKAQTPHLFFYCSHPDNGTYLLIPRTSSERSEYIPIGFEDSSTVSSDANSIVVGASLYHFGIIASQMHMAWVRTIGGRLKSDYRYSGSVIYNTFPWPDAKETQRQVIEVLAQKVLDARDLYPELTLADLYDPDKMPQELKDAHEHLDRAVDQLYRAKAFENDEERLQMLFEKYEKLVAAAKKDTAKKGKTK